MTNPPSTHTAPDGRRFSVYRLGRCFHQDPCWCARCQCGTKLTAHAFTEDEALSEALGALAPGATDEHRCRQKPP